MRSLAGFDNVWRIEGDADKLTIEIAPVKLKDDEHLPIHAQGRKVAVEGSRTGNSLVFDLIAAEEYRKAKGKGGITNADIGHAIRRLADADPHGQITTPILASEIWTANPDGPSAANIKRLLDREKGRRFLAYIKHPGTGRYDPTLWYLPSVDDLGVCDV